MRRLTITLAAAMALCFLALNASVASAVPPVISNTSFSAVRTDSVTLEAEINPQGKATAYHFEYGSAPCSSNPCTALPEGVLVSGTSSVPVSAEVNGLSPHTTYYFRVVAKNAQAETTNGPDTTFTTYVEEQIFKACPNDAFRTEPPRPSAKLPDCRAYEQASPVEKNGLDAIGEPQVVKASVNGDAISFIAASGIPGGEGAQIVPPYLASRGEGDWSTQGMLPPESYGQEAGVAGWTPSFSEVFDWAQTVSLPRTTSFLSRSSADRSIATIVPPTNLEEGGFYSYAGASADGNEVFFEAKGAPLAPGAAAGKNNLYVWDREGEELSAVGILPDSACGSPPCPSPGGSFGGPYDWAHGVNVSPNAGGSTLAYYTQDEQAISNDGSVYFTAGESGQLYRRTDPTGPAAATVQVSASQKDNGKGPPPEHHDAAGPRPAAFMAATPDGSSAFFASSEKLTNDATTGPEPEAPAIARANIDGTAPALGFLLGKASGIAVDSSHIYWANPEAGTIERANLDGSGLDEDFIVPGLIEVEAGVQVPSKPQWVAVDSEYVYWTDAADGKEHHGTIGRAKLGATEAEEVEPEFIKGVTKPQGIDVDVAHIYWVNAGLNGAETGYVGRANIEGNEPEQEFIPVASVDVAVNGTKIYYSYYSGGVGVIRRKNLDGTGSTENIVVFSSAKGPAIDLDGFHLYWTNPTGSKIGRANLDGSSPEEGFIASAARPLSLAINSTHIYWSANQEIVPNPGNDLYRWDADTEELTDLTVDESHPNGAEVRGVLGTSNDGSYVYFAANAVLTSTPNGEGESASPGNCPERVGNGVGTGTCNLYLLHEGAISFIARVRNSLADELNWAPTYTVSTSPRLQKTSRITPDGQTLLFASQRQLTPYDNAGKQELYRYRVGEPGLICVSCNPTEAPPIAQRPTPIYFSVLAPSVPASTLSRTLSDSGDRVFFETTDPLVAADTNGEGGCPTVGSNLQSFSACQDVYEWEAEGSGSCESQAQNGGCLYLLSTGASPDPSFLADASASGNDVFLFTRQAGLVRQDGDKLLDVYDARVNGGLSAQDKAPPVPCASIENCHETSPVPPPLGTIGTQSASGSGNINQHRHPKKSSHHKKRSHKRHGHRNRNVKKSRGVGP